jgi:hypothetical protein
MEDIMIAIATEKRGRMRTELEVVRLKKDVSGIPAGAVGTVMIVQPENPKMLIEFPDPAGKEILLIEVHEDDLESTIGPAAK